jgi:hypothetical protein
LLLIYEGILTPTLTGALKSYRDSLGIAEKLAKQDPGNALWQRDLSVIYDNVGDVQRAQGDLGGASHASESISNRGLIRTVLP